jgi:hypothetical protein
VVALKALVVGTLAWVLLSVAGLGEQLKNALLQLAPLLQHGICQLSEDCAGTSAHRSYVFVMVFFITTMTNAVSVAYSGLVWSLLYVVSSMLIVTTSSRLFASYGGDLVSWTSGLLMLGGTLAIPMLIDLFLWKHMD